MAMDDNASTLLFGAVVSYWLFRKARKFQEAYWSERRGRTRVEMEMRRLTRTQLKTDVGFFVQPIGTLKSCYRQCIGTPRQGLLVPASRATVDLASNMSPECLDGLEEFSHVWLTFQFHLNTNTLKEAKAFKGVLGNDEVDSKGQGPPKGKRAYTFTAKITPPMLKQKKGVLATRSPHRPNPIGLTLARVTHVDVSKRCIHLAACDLVDGTPILDIKPYVPSYDTIPSGDWVIPTWIRESVGTRNVVTMEASVEEFVLANQMYLREFKDDASAFMNGLIQTLEAEVRSKFQTQKRVKDASKNVTCEVTFDEILVHYLWIGEREMHITDVTLIESSYNRKLAKKLRKAKEQANEGG